MLFINKDLFRITGNEHDIVVETVTMFMEVFHRLTPQYKKILLLTLSHELERIEYAEGQESSDETD